MTVAADSANVRQRPTYESELLATLPQGSRVVVLGSDQGWAHIQGNGADGYIERRHLALRWNSLPTEPSVPAGLSVPAELSVPTNRRTDLSVPTQRSGESVPAERTGLSVPAERSGLSAGQR